MSGDGEVFLSHHFFMKKNEGYEREACSSDLRYLKDILFPILVDSLQKQRRFLQGFNSVSDARVKDDHFAFFHIYVSFSSSYPDPSAEYLDLEYAIHRIILYPGILMQAGKNRGEIFRLKNGYSIPVIFIPCYFALYLFDKLIQVHKYI